MGSLKLSMTSNMTSGILIVTFKKYEIEDKISNFWYLTVRLTYSNGESNEKMLYKYLDLAFWHIYCTAVYKTNGFKWVDNLIASLKLLPLRSRECKICVLSLVKYQMLWLQDGLVG